MSKLKTAEVVIAEDDLIIARLEQYSLQKTVHCTPIICKNGKEAIKYLDKRKDPETPVLLILDLNMPVLDGWDVLEILESKPYSKNIFVVVVTSSIFQEDQKRALNNPQVIGYFVKPLFRDHFKQIFELPQINHLFADSILPHA